jgi:hypothetical protein
VSGDADTDAGDRWAVTAVVCLLLGVYWLTMGGHTYSVDGETYLAGTRSLLRHTTLLTPGPDVDGIVITVPHKNGGTTTAAPLGTLLLFAPGYVAGRVAAAPFPEANQQEVIRLLYLSANSVMTAVTAGLLLALCRALGASRRSAILLALAYGLGTWAWGHAQTDFSEPGTAMVLAAAMLASVRWWRAPTLRHGAITGLLAGSLVLTRSSTLIFVPILAVAGSLKKRTAPGPSIVAQLASFCAGGLLPGALFALTAYLRFGSPFDSGYPDLAYNTPVYEGVFGLFLSPGKGLFWYAPICLVALFGMRRAWLAQPRFVYCVGAIVVVHLGVYARFETWSGENAYGPRYLIPLLPLFVALVAPVADNGPEWRRAIKATAVVGFVVPGLLGTLLYFNGVYFKNQPQVLRNLGVETATFPQQNLAWDFQPRSSPLMLHLRSLPDLARNTVDRVSGESGGITPIPAPYEERIHWYARTIGLDTWWAWWSAKHEPASGLAFLLAPLGALGIAADSARRIRRGNVSERGAGATAVDDPVVAG